MEELMELYEEYKEKIESGDLYTYEEWNNQYKYPAQSFMIEINDYE